MKRLLRNLTPVLIVGLLLYVLIDFKHVETLTPQERAAIERYRQELLHGTLAAEGPSRPILTEAEFQMVAQSINKLHQYENYLVYGKEWGYPIPNKDEEFQKLFLWIERKERSRTPYRPFFSAMREDLTNAKNQWGTEYSHNILHDLEEFAFSSRISTASSHGVSKTLNVMKQQGLKLIEQDKRLKQGTPPSPQHP